MVLHLSVKSLCKLGLSVKSIHEYFNIAHGFNRGFKIQIMQKRFQPFICALYKPALYKPLKRFFFLIYPLLPTVKTVGYGFIFNYYMHNKKLHNPWISLLKCGTSLYNQCTFL